MTTGQGQASTPGQFRLPDSASGVQLPTPPAGLAMVLEAAGDEDTSLATLAILVRNEPSLTTNLLRLANSAAFGVGRPVRSVTQATMFLGARVIRNITVGHVVRVMTSGTKPTDFDITRFWEDSLRRASAAHVLATMAGYEDPSEAFTAGLIQDLGVLLMAVIWPQHSKALNRSVDMPVQQRLETEFECVRATHNEVFAAIAREWSVPADLVTAIAAHHDDVIAIDDRRCQRLAELLRVGDALADLTQVGTDEESLERLRVRIAALRSREPLTIEILVDAVAARMREMSSMLQINIGEQPTYEELLTATSRAGDEMSSGYEEMTRQLEEALRDKERLERQLRMQNEELTELAATDALTGVANRRQLDIQLGEILERAGETATPVSVLMVDLDHFKAINDRYGHAAGDQVLRHTAQRLANCLRTEDLVARLGGEEFAVVLPDCDAESGAVVAERLRRSISAAPVPISGGLLIRFSASFGGATVLGGGVNADDILRRCDRALYLSKYKGRDQINWHD